MVDLKDPKIERSKVVILDGLTTFNFRDLKGPR